MSEHVHYDLDAFEREMRANFDRAVPRNEFERHQAMGNEVSIQFNLFSARMENEGVSEEAQIEAACAIIAGLVENLALDYEGEPAAIAARILMKISGYALRGGEVVSVTDIPRAQAGRA